MRTVDKVVNALGPLTVISRAKLLAVLTDPSLETWNEAKWVVINRSGLSLQEICGRETLSCPSKFVLLRAMQKAGEGK